LTLWYGFLFANLKQLCLTELNGFTY
jgi:hypothetical protein